MKNDSTKLELIDTYHDGFGKDHVRESCRICFLLDEVKRWRSAHDTQVRSKRFKAKLVRDIIVAVRGHGGKVIISGGGKVVKVEFGDDEQRAEAAVGG